MSTPPSGSPPAPRNQLMSALIWMIGSAVIAAFALYRGLGQDERKTFYVVAGVIAVAAAVLNGYAVWKIYQESKIPPPA